MTPYERHMAIRAAQVQLGRNEAEAWTVCGAGTVTRHLTGLGHVVAYAIAGTIQRANVLGKSQERDAQRAYCRMIHTVMETSGTH